MTWVELGLDPDRFWRITPRLFFLTIEAVTRRLHNDHNSRAWLAWNIAALTKARRLPRLDSLMIKRRNRRAQTWQEQLAVAKLITAAHGGKS